MEERDEGAFIDFYSQHIGRERLEQRFRWLYRGNPHGAALTWVAFAHDGAMVGCTSIFPRRMWMRDRETLGSHGGDALVASDYRRRGIAKALHDLSLSEMRAAGIRLIYGFPVPKNLGAFLKIGAHSPGRFELLRFQLSSAPLVEQLGLGPTATRALGRLVDVPVRARAKRMLESGPAPVGRLEPVEAFGSGHDEVWAQARGGFGICCVRDSAYLNWRYFENPARAHEALDYVRDGELRGYAVVEFVDDRCIVFDLMVREPAEELEDLIGLVLRRAEQAGCAQVRFMSAPGGTYAAAFKRCGFRPGTRGMSHPLMVLVGPDEVEPEWIAELAQWFLTYGDEDREAFGW